MASPKSSSASRATDLRNHGIAVTQGRNLCVKPWRDAATGRDYIYIGILCGGPSIVVQLDVATGKCRQFNLPGGCDGPWAIAFTLEGHVLVTSVNGTLGRIDPRSGKVWVTARPGQWLWYIDRGSDGKFYLASSPESRLFRYDAATEKIEDLGPVDKVQKFLRHVYDGRDGYIYCSVGISASQIIAYPIATGRKTPVLPKHEVAPDFQRLARGIDDKIYVKTVAGNTYRIAHGQAFPVSNIDHLWIRPVTHNWDEMTLLPDGRKIVPLDPDALRIGEGRTAKIMPYTYTSPGAGIFHLAEGPGKAIYASTIMPLYILRYTPKTRKLENLGRGGPDTGEAYSIGHVGGKLYYATYSGGRLLEYDPARPLHNDPPGELKWRDNPKLIVPHMGAGHCRTRAMCIDSRKRVWVGSHAEYGMRHGGLYCYDTVGRKGVNNPVVIPDQSIQSLTTDASEKSDGVIYGGTDICRGSGMDAVTKEAHLFAWDGVKQKLLWKLIPRKGQTGIINLLYHNGKLYGTARPTFSFFCFDPVARKMDYFHESKIDCCREQSMTLGPDGNIYGITWLNLFRWHLESGQIDVLHGTTQAQAGKYPGGSLFHRGAAIIDGRYYFSCGASVMSMKLPPFHS